jgi:hypothetical protein
MYRIELEGKLIGQTRLEGGDPPMGVVVGQVIFSIADSPYSLFKNYCKAHGVKILLDEEEFEAIDTQNIHELKVYRNDGIEIAGFSGASISGLHDEGYWITIIGIPYPFYKEEFPHHYETYENQFRNPVD